MAGTIHVVNIHTDDCSGKDNYFYIGRSKDGNPLGNPFTHNGAKSSLAKLTFKTREEAIAAYKKYFEISKFYLLFFPIHYINPSLPCSLGICHPSNDRYYHIHSL